jgi:hypothetical protein
MKPLKYGVRRSLPDGRINPEWCKRVYAALTPEERAHKNKVHSEWAKRNKAKTDEYRRRYFEKHPDAKERIRKINAQWRREWKAKPENKKRYYEAMKRFHLKRGYAMTLEEYKKKLKAQRYKCAICCTPHKEESRKRLHVDHDHKTNKNRDLLCHDCNVMLGRAGHDGDSIEILKKAVAYLERHMD